MHKVTIDGQEYWPVNPNRKEMNERIAQLTGERDNLAVEVARYQAAARAFEQDRIDASNEVKVLKNLLDERDLEILTLRNRPAAATYTGEPAPRPLLPCAPCAHCGGKGFISIAFDDFSQSVPCVHCQGRTI